MLERAAVRNALKRTRSPAIKAQANTVKFSSKLPYESDCDSGVDFTISARNQTSEVYTINVAVTAQLVRYTGVTLQKIKKKTDSYTLKADEGMYLYEGMYISRSSNTNLFLQNCTSFFSTKSCKTQKCEMVLKVLFSVVYLFYFNTVSPTPFTPFIYTPWFHDGRRYSKRNLKIKL